MDTYVNRQTYSVLPTPTEVVELETRNTRSLTVSVTNLDGLQTVDVSVFSRVWAGDDLGQAALADLTSIQPGETRPAHVTIGNADSVLFKATASGLGCDIRLSVRPDGGKR